MLLPNTLVQRSGIRGIPNRTGFRFSHFLIIMTLPPAVYFVITLADWLRAHWYAEEKL
jgi:hypothetical protein